MNRTTTPRHRKHPYGKQQVNKTPKLFRTYSELVPMTKEVYEKISECLRNRNDRKIT